MVHHVSNENLTFAVLSGYDDDMKKILVTFVTVALLGAAFMVYTGFVVAGQKPVAITAAPTVSATPSQEPAPASPVVIATPDAVPSATPAITASATPEPAPEFDATASQFIEALNALNLVNAVEDGGYNRSEDFGSAWTDVDQNGCDTRNDILNRDLTAITYKTASDSCTVATGTLNDPYTGQTIDFVRGQETSMAVQIDHIIPLKYAYMHGATGWSQDVRELFANDPDNLLAVDGPSNSSKSAKGPENWMPENTGYACEYAERFVNVADKYDVSITTNDYDVLYDALLTCAA